MKKFTIALHLFLLAFVFSTAQQKAIIKETVKAFKTYPFSDPDPIPEMGKIYPYFRFDGYTNTPVRKGIQESLKWKMIISK
ncbi:MAG: hypothetical protein WKG06_31705 [Segetibacter sp.]